MDLFDGGFFDDSEYRRLHRVTYVNGQWIMPLLDRKRLHPLNGKFVYDDEWQEEHDEAINFLEWQRCEDMGIEHYDPKHYEDDKEEEDEEGSDEEEG